MAARIIIQHVSAAKANQIEQFPVDGLAELSIGRDPGCNIVFDSGRDDYVSRRHAAIRIENGERFKLVDLGSRNGTRLNGEVVTAETELSPGDTIELGAGGPRFTFDVQPRPATFMARTRIISKDVAATRILSPASGNAPAKEAAATPLAAQPVTTGIGRNTVIGMMAAQQSRTNRNWTYVLAGVLFLVAAGGGGLYYHNKIKADEAAAEMARQAEQLKAQKESAAAEAARQAAALQAQKAAAEQAARRAKEESDAALKKAMGLGPREIVRKFGNAVVLIEVQWRLFDQPSGKPLFHKVVTVKDRKYPAYVQLGNDKFVRWLTTEDENQTNIPMGIAAQGSGFVISSQGYLLTNKHVAAGWTVRYSRDAGFQRGVAFDIRQKQPPYFFNPSEQDELRLWIPEQGVVFRPDIQMPVDGRLHPLEGRNDQLDVRFPGSPLRLAARLMRVSVEADVAEIKVDSEQPLTAVELSDGSTAPVGEQVTVLGYPSFSDQVMSRALIPSTELGNRSQHQEVVPEPTVTSGNISLISTGVQRSGGLTTVGVGDAYQLTVPSTHGNSGGPVFDHTGKVIGIFTYGTARETTTYAIPIKFGIELFKVQRATPK
ncbi:trypsin-like peptidase domain-containing protein [Reyranella sp.]|jgi:S1-C subfamily serine protease|uniref:trypsin-like peptidase domain-containing protein n=1 Tax=Reyranella sp. TaxID=1929291 RepID=UPI002F932B62